VRVVLVLGCLWAVLGAILLAGAAEAGLRATSGYPPPPGSALLRVSGTAARRSEPLSDRELASMVDVPAGFFLMGADDGFADERPQRRAFVESYRIDKYEVTNQEFRAAGMRPARSYGPGFEAPQLPVVGVTWHQAREYCRRLGKRLPTEAEWEKAARGEDGRSFPWGNFWDPARANDGRGPRPVGSFPDGVSPFGAYDMAGNVWEWVRDRYPLPATDWRQERRVLRGGAWNYPAVYHRTSYRRHERPDYAERRIGFRCAQDAH
jgi:formylglycine-generating enzyme required for sulfatase activity